MHRLILGSGPDSSDEHNYGGVPRRPRPKVKLTSLPFDERIKRLYPVEVTHDELTTMYDNVNLDLLLSEDKRLKDAKLIVQEEGTPAKDEKTSSKGTRYYLSSDLRAGVIHKDGVATYLEIKPSLERQVQLGTSRSSDIELIDSIYISDYRSSENGSYYRKCRRVLSTSHVSMAADMQISALDEKTHLTQSIGSLVAYLEIKTNSSYQDLSLPFYNQLCELEDAFKTHPEHEKISNAIKKYLIELANACNSTWRSPATGDPNKALEATVNLRTTIESANNSWSINKKINTVIGLGLLIVGVGAILIATGVISASLLTMLPLGILGTTSLALCFFRRTKPNTTELIAHVTALKPACLVSQPH